ncbi:MAG: TlpA family protein disulfide reductase [Candidatus Yanofskybacteria bacterium]|nr:TlpA family protein disulfide reductase [Candidatus Yanofskybacteria bacterium]
MSKVLVIILGVIVVGIAGWLVVSKNNAPREASRQAQSERAPDFNLQDYNGKTVRFADFAGKPLVINSWAAWCPFCRKELVDFAVAQKEFGDDVTIIAIDRAESRETAKKYTDELGVTNLIFLLDPSDSFYQSIDGFSMPETIFVDREGNIAERKRGPMEIKEIREKIQKLLSS